MTPEPSGQSAAQQILTLLDASNARANAATEGPWIKMEDGCEAIVINERHGMLFPTLGNCEAVHRDAIFIAAARTELPRANEAIRVLVEGLLESQKAFQMYVEIHEEKKTPDGDAKALFNQKRADRIDGSLTRAHAILTGAQ